MTHDVICPGCGESVPLDVLDIHLEYECINNLSKEKFKRKSKTDVDNKNV
jgi:hypothetical protein